MCDNNKAIKALLDIHSDVLAKNLNGEIPIDLAVKTKNEFYESMKK